MENLKAYYITDGNTIKDMIIGTEEKRSIAENTLKFIKEEETECWVKSKIVTLNLEGEIHTGHINIITTIKVNGVPLRAIANNFYNLVEIIEKYMDSEDDYRKYTYKTEYIKM